MKKLYTLLAIAFVSVFVFSCSSDDNGSKNITADQMIGKWIITDYSDSQIKSLAELVKVEPCGDRDVFDFSTNGILYFSYAYGTNCSSSGTNNLKYSLSGNLLTTVEEGAGYNPNTDYIVKYQVVAVTSSTLILKAVYVDDGYGDNPDLSNEEMFTVSFKRI